MSTLVHDPIFVEVPAFFGCDVEALFRRLVPEVWYAFERGDLDEAEFFRRWMRDGTRVDVPALKRCLRGAYRYLHGVEPLLADLTAAGVELHALSNYPTWYRLIEESVGLSRYVRWTFVSCRTGIRKPDPEAYLGAARALDRPPAACLFVDDRPANVEAAEAVGMPALRFRDADQLRADLIAAGVLPTGRP